MNPFPKIIVQRQVSKDNIIKRRTNLMLLAVSHYIQRSLPYIKRMKLLRQFIMTRLRETITMKQWILYMLVEVTNMLIRIVLKLYTMKVIIKIKRQTQTLQYIVCLKFLVLEREASRINPKHMKKRRRDSTINIITQLIHCLRRLVNREMNWKRKIKRLQILKRKWE